MLRLQLIHQPRRLGPPAPVRWDWAMHEMRNRRAANAYPERVRCAARPGCAGGCGLVVAVAGRMCKTCRAERA